MAGKSKMQKKKRANVRKREHELANQQTNVVRAEVEKQITKKLSVVKEKEPEFTTYEEMDKLGNNAEPLPAEINEPQEEAKRERLADEVADQALLLADVAKEKVAILAVEEPFDINAFVANTVKKAQEK